MRTVSKMPTLVGLFLLLIGVGAGVLLIQREKIFNLSAAPTQAPKDVRITNTTDRGFTISWVTSESTSGFVSYGKNSSVGTVINQDGGSASSYIHHVTVDNLSSNTQFYFKIGVGESGITKSKLYSLKTGPSLNKPPTPDIIFGSVITEQGGPADKVVVYVTVPNAAPLSTLTDNKGKWSINLSSARSSNLASFSTYDKTGAQLEIFVQAGNEKFSSAKIKAGAAHPVPQMTLGKVHDFTNVKPVTDSKVPQSELDLTLQQSSTPQSSPSPSPVSGFTSKPKPSPSAKASPKPSPSPSPAAVGGPVASPSPSASPKTSPKPSPSPSPSVKTSVATGSAYVTTSQDTLPSAGNLTVTMFVFIMGMILVVVGFFVPKH